MKPEWVNLSIKERADASAAEVEAVSAQIAQDLHKKTQILNTPHTGALVESLVSIAGQSPTFDDFKKNAGDHPYSEAAIATMYRDVVESKSQALRDHNKDAFFSDQTLNASATATVANMGLAAAGRVPEVGGNLANLSIEGVKAVQKAGLTQDDYVDYQSIQAKQAAYKDAADALQNPVNSRPETQKILQERMAKNSPESYSEGEKSLFKENIAVMPATNNMGMPNMAAPVLMSKMDKLQGITELTRGQEHVRELSKVVSKFVNTTSVDQMAAETKRNFESADGLIETAGVYLDAIVSNPTAVAHVAVQSTPEILMSLTGAGFVTSVASNFSEKTLEAREHYKNTFGVDASGDADNQLLAGAATAAFIDTGADRLIGGGGFKITEKLAEKGILQGAGIASKAARGTLGATQAVGSGFVLEGAAEGFGEAMTQAAGKQGYADIDWGQSFVEGALGSGSGAGIAGIGSALKGTKEAATETAQKMAGRIKAKETNDISGLVSNPLTADVAGAAKVLVSINANPDVDKEVKDKATNDFEVALHKATVLQVAATRLRDKAENGGGLNTEETRTLELIENRISDFQKQREILKQAQDQRDGISIEESINVLTAPTMNEDGTQPDNEISQMAISKVIQETMDAQTLFSAEDAQAILDNHGDQGTGNLTGEQMASLRAHIAVQHALGEAEALAGNGVKTIESVRNDIYNGSPTQFGAKQYVAGILASLKHGDTGSAEYLLEGLAQFTAGHQNKAGVLAAIAASFVPKADGKVSPFTAEQQVAMAAEKGIKLRETGFTSNSADKMANAVGQEAKTLVTVLHAMGARMEAHTQSKTEPASVPVDTVAESQTEATVSTQPQAEPTQQTTEVDSTNRASEITTGGNLTQPVSGTLDELLDLPVEDAIAKLAPNWDGVYNTADEVKMTDDDAPDYEQDSQPISEVDTAIGKVRIVETKSGAIQAVNDKDQVVSFAGLQDGVTVLQNHENAPRGIGTQVIKEFIRRNPNADAGTFTEGGKKAYIRALNELKAERDNQPSKREVISPERETEVETGTVSDEVLNEGVVAEQADGGIDTWDSLVEQREEMYQAEFNQISSDGVQVDENLTALNELAFADAPLSKYRISQIAKRIPKDVIAAFQQINKKITNSLKEPELLRNLRNDPAYPNLLVKFFRVKPSARTTPIVSIPGFISKLKDEAVRKNLLAQSGSNNKKSDEGKELVLTKLAAFTESFRAALDSSILFDQWTANNAINHFVLAEANPDGSMDIKSEVKDAMAVAIFNFIADSASDSLTKTDKQIGKVLGLDLQDGTRIHNEVRKTVGKSGIPYADKVLNVGNEISKLLGLQLSPEAGKDLHHTFQTELAISLGNAAINAMFNVTDTAGNPVMKSVVISAYDMNIAYELLENQVSLETAKSLVNTKGYVGQFSNPTRTIQVAFTEDVKSGVRKPNDYIQGEVIGPVQAAGSFLQEVFGTLKATKFPTFAPVVITEETDVKLKRTEQKAATEAREAQNKLNSTPNYLKNWFVRLSGSMSAQRFAEMIGLDTDIDSHTHVDNRESANSVNQLKLTEVERMYTFHEQYQNSKNFVELGYKTPFYLEHEQNRTVRAQIKQNVMNDQSNKDTRHTMYKGDWKQTYSVNPAAGDLVSHQNRMAWELAVGQALGIAIDKQSPEDSQRELAALMEDEVLMAAVEAASHIDEESEISEETLSTFENALSVHGKSTATLDGIFALGAMVRARREKKLYFESDIGIEYDGVTDGPMRVLLQYAKVDETWAAQLAAGGIYVNRQDGLSDIVTGAIQGILDRYQYAIVTAEGLWDSPDRKTSAFKVGNEKVSLILQHTDKYTGKVIDQKSLLNRLFGPMVNRKDDDTFSISKIMRNIAKVIVTPMGYQAAPQSSQNAFGNTIHERVTTMFENMHKIQIGDINPDSKKGREIIAEAATLNEVFKQLAPGFIVPVRDDKGNIQWLKSKVNIDTKFPFPAWVDNGKGKGKPGHYFMTVPDYLGKTYGKVLTDAVEEISESSKELRADTVNVTNMSVAMFEAARDHLVTEALASKQGAKGAAAVLTIAEAEAIQEKLKAIHPELASALTSELGEGVSILKTKGTALQERTVQTKLKPTKFNAAKHSEVATPTSNIKSPGVSAVPVQILADDASNLIRGTLRSTDQTVLHDASISSPVHAVANNAHWNTVMYENAVTHSVPVATANTASRILEGAKGILGDGFVLPEVLVKKYNLKDFYEKATGIHYPATALQIEAIIASYSVAADVQFQSRKEALANGIVTFNHYAAHGADVTFENGVKRNLASMSKEELASELPKSISDLASKIKNDSVTEYETEVLPANWYAPLFKVLDDSTEPVTVTQAMATIDVKKLSPNLKAAEIVLKKLSTLIDPDTRIIMYDPAQTYTGDLAWLNTAESVRAKATNSVGLHVPRDNKETGGVNKPVIILMKSTNTNETGISQETLMHELLHAALDGYIGDKSSQFYKDITALMEAVRTQLGDEAINQPGLTNVREFVAYGLSNAAFQSVLKNTAVSAKFIGSQIAPHVGGAWARFKNAVINAIFGTEVKNKDINNAMSALMEVVAVVGQQNVVIKSTPKPSAEIGQQQTNHGHRHDISRTNSMELFDRMKHMGHTKASVAHRNTLAGVLESIVNVAMTPLQVIIKGNQIGESFGDLTATDRLEIYSATVKDATVQGLPNQIGFNKSVQESYVYGLMQAVLDEGLTATTGYSNAANKLFNAAKDKLTYLDFMEDPASQDPAEIEFAKRRYDSVFDVSSHAANTYSDTSSGLTFDMHHSNYLRNFLSLAATNEKFGQALSTVSVPESKKAETVLDKIIGLITDVFNFILNKTTGVNTKENLKVNLDRLTARLLTKHLEEQSKVEKLLDQGLHYTSVGVGYIAEVLKQGIAKAAGTAYVRNHSSSTVRVVGDIARLMGTDRSEYLFKSMDDMFSQVSAGKQAFAGELMTEVKGTTRDTTKVHTLLRVANHVLDRGRKEVIETTKRMLVRSFHRDLTTQEKVGLTKFLLRTDAVSLNALGYTQGQLADLIDRPTYRAQEIAVLEGKISGFVLDAKLRDYYLNQAEELGAMMVNGTSTNPHAVANAHLIATVAGMTTLARPDDSTITAVLPLIDGLATLHAIHRTAAKGKYTGVANLIREEYARNDDNGDRDNNGITFMMRTHMQVQEKALKENFAGNPVLMRKGHMPSITNSYIDVQVAQSFLREEMAARGYTEAYKLENDANHHMAPKRSMFLSKAGGLATFQRMALSTTQNKTKGFKITDPGDIAILAATAIQQEARLTNGRVSPLYSRNPVHAQATFNEDGKVVGYRYVITEATKDNLLERDDNFAEVLAKHAGNVYDKAVSKPHNEMVIKALKEQYDIDMAAGKGHKYIRLSLKSDDPELVELYKLLPDATRDHIKKVFGTDSIPVRAEFLRVVFGFRNVAITDLWQAETENGFFGNLVKGTFDALPGGSGVVVASHFERGLKDIVRVAKTNLVVRSGVITAANFVSNTYDLVINGLSVREAASWQADGYKYGIQYIKLASRVSEINMLLGADHNPSHRKKLESEKAQLMNLQATNPAAKLIEAGLLQTIVLEVNQDIDPYSMTAKWAKALEDRTSKLPQGVQDVGKFVLMTRDSQSFELMNRLVQFGDFAARYALYKKLTTQKYNQVSHVDAIQKVITHFVNYDLPTHRMIQYGNDMGFIWFSRYWIRIQKVILTNFAENPGRVLTGLMLQGLLGVDVSDTHDSSVISTGVFHPFGGFDRVASGLLTNPVLLQ